MLSGTAQYALRAVMHLARAKGSKSLKVSELADATGVPRNYLGKILHELVRGGVLRSTRGKHGGFRLAVNPSDLPLLRVVSLFDALDGERQCLVGRPECSDRDPCPVHHRWKVASEHIAQFFRETTVADVITS